MKSTVLNTTELAFLGDAFFEIEVRKRVLQGGLRGADRLHRKAVRYVRAEAQARMIKVLFDEELTDTERDFVKRARNRKSATKPKNASVMDYKWATAFEALLGKLYVEENQDRLAEITEKAIAVIDKGVAFEKEGKK